MSSFAAEHGRRVRAIVHGTQCHDASHIYPHGNAITASWIRCLNDYRLDPDRGGEVLVVERQQLQQRRARLARLCQVAELEMASLCQQLAGSGYAIMLADHDGVLLHFFGDPAFAGAAAMTGMMAGAVWSEQVQGTNGLGTCLAERRPVAVHQEEHYLSRNIALSCAAAPIFDHRGELVAVLDASGLSGLAQQHTLALVSVAAQQIEHRLFLRQFQQHFIVRFHQRAELVGTPGEGALALSASGRVLAATGRALQLLGSGERADVEGRDFGELFNTSLHELIAACVRAAWHPLPIVAQRRGARVFAISHGPAPAPSVVVPVRRAPQPQLSAAAGLASGASTGAGALEQLHWGDPEMAHNVQVARRVMERDVAVMLLGETGTGKELFAQALHRSSSRADKPFVAINCASIPESLIESELFGYLPGAFTGARKDGHAGKLLHANGGTLFLDEIGDMPVALQARLLRVLEERAVLPLGGKAAIKLDIRLISATHCDLQAKIADRQFREDLFYRLHGIAISMPPLRQRADRRQLIEHVLAEESAHDGAIVLDAALLGAFERHPWPGNIRQLRQLLRTMIALRESACLTVADLPRSFAAACSADPAAVDANAGAAACQGAAADKAMNPLESAEREALVRELTRHGWNISTLARTLNISRNTLYRKVQRLNIRNPGKAVLH